MKHIVFLVGEYYPNFSANGLCFFNIADEISKQNKITVICYKSKSDQPKDEVYKGQKIIRISHLWWDLRLKFANSIQNSKGIKKALFLLGFRLVQIKEYLQIILSKVTVKSEGKNSFYRALEDIKEPIDAIIPCCYPIETVVAGMKFKMNHLDVKLLPFFFDPFLESHSLHRTNWNKKIKRKNNARLEVEILKLSTKVFCLNNVEEHFINNYGEYGQVAVQCELPLVKQIVTNKIACKKENHINLFYAGAFDKFIRNPKYFLKLSSIALQEFDARLKLYSFGNCSNIVNTYAYKSNGKIIEYGYTPKDDVNRAMLDSDILISVGNIDNLQESSKIFEYMSVGKPIILFYSNSDDANLKRLKHYPLSLCLKQDESLFDENVLNFIKFCTENKGQTINFKEVEQAFYKNAPQYVANQIINEV